MARYGRPGTLEAAGETSSMGNQTTIQASPSNLRMRNSLQKTGALATCVEVRPRASAAVGGTVVGVAVTDDGDGDGDEAVAKGVPAEVAVVAAAGIDGDFRCYQRPGFGDFGHKDAVAEASGCLWRDVSFEHQKHSVQGLGGNSVDVETHSSPV